MASTPPHLHTLPYEFLSTSGILRWSKSGSGPPLILNHGTPFSSYVWRDIAEALSASYTVYLWDMPGYGQSAMFPDQDVSLAAQGRIFASLLAYWAEEHQQQQKQRQEDEDKDKQANQTPAGVEYHHHHHHHHHQDNDNGTQIKPATSEFNPIIIAHDFGGTVALRAHLLHKAPYRALVLLDPVALPPWGTPFFRLVGSNPDLFEQLPPNQHEAFVREYVLSSNSPGLHPSALDALVAPWLSPAGAGAGAGGAGQGAFYRQIAQADQRYTDEIKVMYPGMSTSIPNPVVVCWGEDDTWIPVEKGRELAGLIPGARLRIIPGAGHLVQLDKPAQLTAILMRELASFT